MSAALVQSNFNNGSTTVTCTFGAAVTAGNLIVVAFFYTGTGVTPTLSDNTPGGSNTYVQVASALAVNTTLDESADIWYVQNAAGGATTITVTPNTGFVAACAYEFSGMVTSSPLDGNGVNASNVTSSGTTANGPSITPTQSDVLVTAEDSNSGIASVASPWIGENLSAFSTIGSAYLLNSSVSSQMPVFTAKASSDPYLVAMAAFKVAGSPPSGFNFVGQTGII